MEQTDGRADGQQLRLMLPFRWRWHNSAAMSMTVNVHVIGLPLYCYNLQLLFLIVENKISIYLSIDSKKTYKSFFSISEICAIYHLHKG